MAAVMGLAASITLRDFEPANLVFVVLAVWTGAFAPVWVRDAQSAVDADRVTAALRWRWRAVSGGALLALALFWDRPSALVAAGLGLLWLVLVSLLLRGLARWRPQPAAEWLHLMLFGSDLWLITVAAYLGLAWTVVAGMLMVSLAIALAFERRPTAWFSLLALALCIALLRNAVLDRALGLPPSYLILMVMLSAAGTLILRHLLPRSR